MIISNRYFLNPNLIANDLGDNFALYVPPDPKPLRLAASIWQVISALRDVQLSEAEWSRRLGELQDIEENSWQDFPWLLNNRILLPIQQQFPDSLNKKDSASDRASAVPMSSIDDVTESRSLHLFTWNPSWPTPLKTFLLYGLRFQLWLAGPMLLVIFAYLFFFLLSPAPSALNLFGSWVQIPSEVNVLFKILIGLLTVNLFSTSSTWLVQSITGLGDGKIVLRFLFGFIPRFGVNPYKGIALRSNQWTDESRNALLCISQPLLTRLAMASLLIVLITSGRIPFSLGGAWMYSTAHIVLQISIISFLILALPFRMSPGYRLMILLTDLPPNTLSQSVFKLYDTIRRLIRWLASRDSTSFDEFQSSLSTRRDVGLFVLAIVFTLLLCGKLLLIIFLVIPRLAYGLPQILGGASQLIFSLILFVLLWRFVSKSILPKLLKLTSRSVSSSSSVSQPDDVRSHSSLFMLSEARLSQSQKKWVATSVVVVLLFLPIDRTVTGSVLVSSERDLTVRASEDLHIIQILKSGPSTNIITTGTPLLQLDSKQLERDLHQSAYDLVQLRKELSTFQEEQKANQNILIQVVGSLKTHKQIGQLLDDQLEDLEALAKVGALSRQALQESLLTHLNFEEQARLKFQSLLELEAERETLEIKMTETENAIEQVAIWRNSLIERKQQLTITMPFDGLITSSTSGLLDSFHSKGDSLLELKEGSLNLVNVLIPDHDRSLVKTDQSAIVRLYANPNQNLNAVVQSIRPSGELIDQKVFFQASLRLSDPLSPQLLQSSGAARIKTGQINLFTLIINSIGRFLSVDVWSWTP